MAEIPQEDQTTRRILIIAEKVSVPSDRRLWSEAIALRNAQYEVSIICPRQRSVELAEEVIDGIRIFRHPLPFRAPAVLGRILELPIALFWEFVLSIKVARRHGFDVVHICNPPNVTFLIGAFYRIFQKKSVLFDFRDAGQNQADGDSVNRGSLAERLAFKYSDICVSTNSTLRQIAINRGRMPAESAIVLRPCPDLERIVARAPDPLWRHARAHMVAYAGEVCKAEGLDHFANTIAYIVHDNQRADIQFVVAGDGPEWHEIASLCGSLDLSDYVTFTGRVDDETLCAILSTADVCVDPRQSNTASAATTSQKIMEYMAIGKPIVQCDLGEGRLVAQEASRYAKTNDPVDFGNQILQLLDSPESRKIMGEFGQKRVQKDLSWQREQRKLIAAYDAIFNARAQRAARGKRSQGRKMQKPHAPKHK